MLIDNWTVLTERIERVAAWVRERADRNYMRSHRYPGLPGDASRMTTHMIIRKVDQPGFGVAVVGNEGARQTLLGFETQADAQAWIAWDKRSSATDDLWVRAHFFASGVWCP